MTDWTDWAWMTPPTERMTETMTRKHFEALASDIGLTLRQADHLGDNSYWVEDLSRSIAATCTATNPAFNRQRFMDRIDQVRKDGLK